MNVRPDFSPIHCPAPDLRKPGPYSPPLVLEFARSQPVYAGMDDTSDYAKAAAARSAVSDKNIADAFGDLMQDLHNYPAAVETFVDQVNARAEELARQTTITLSPDGKWCGIAMDAIAALQSILTIADSRVSLPTAIKFHDIARPVLKKAGAK
jgi:hypothetical protein